MNRRAGVVIASTRAASGQRPDASAPGLLRWLEEQGFQPLDPRIVPDGEPVGEAILALLAAGAAVVLTTGGTGLTPDDSTPEVTRALLDREIPGIMEAIRAAGSTKTPMAALSRGYAGVRGNSLVINLPGSAGGIADGLAVLQPLLGHALEQIEGNHEH